MAASSWSVSFGGERAGLAADDRCNAVPDHSFRGGGAMHGRRAGFGNLRRAAHPTEHPVKPLFAALTAAAAALFLTGASGEEPAMTASDLAQLCSGTDHVSVNSCRIYILGVTQGIAVGLRIAGAGRAGRPCVPPGISAEDLEATVKKRLAAPGAASDARDASGFIGDVLATRYPCSKGREP